MTVEHRVMITLLTMALRMPPSVIAVAKLLHSKSKRRNSELDRSSDGFEEAQVARCAIDAALRPDTTPDMQLVPAKLIVRRSCGCR